jgi:hypothetical protein
MMFQPSAMKTGNERQIHNPYHNRNRQQAEYRRYVLNNRNAEALRLPRLPRRLNHSRQNVMIIGSGRQHRNLHPDLNLPPSEKHLSDRNNHDLELHR